MFFKRKEKRYTYTFYTVDNSMNKIEGFISISLKKPISLDDEGIPKIIELIKKEFNDRNL